MSRTAKELYRELLELSADDRDELIRLLTEARSGGFATPEIEQVWLEECQDRLRNLKAGQTDLVPAEDVLREARDRLTR